MPRTLPWLAEAAKAIESKRIQTSSASTSRQKPESSDDDDLLDDDLNVIRPATPEQKPKKRANRTPSTSPPPAPPDVEYMREGYNADDIYLMVEDEFLSTAKMYTQHIHHAEYVRLKKLATSRGAGALHHIHRPTDGRTKQSNALKMKLESEGKDKKIKNGIKKMGDDEDSSEVEDEYMYDPQLAGLMTRDNPVKRDLSSLSKAKSNTRAAAGSAQSPHNVERKKDVKMTHTSVLADETDDDLDTAPPRKTNLDPSKAHTMSKAPSKEFTSVHNVKPKPTTNGTGIFKCFAESAADEDQDKTPSFMRPSPPRIKRAAEPSPPRSRAFDVENVHKPSSSTQDYLAKRRLELERKEREEKRKAKKEADDVPTFLI